MTQNAPANWYPQPDGSQRYWDGNQWTEHIVPAVAPPAAPSSIGAEAPVGVEAPSGAEPVAQSPGVESPGVESPGVEPAAFGSSAVVAPGGVGAGSDSTPWWRKKRVLIPGGALAAIIGLSAVAAAGGGGAEVATPAAASPSPTPTPSASVTTQAPVIIAMPDLVGMNLQEAQDALQALGSYVLDQEDASGEGRVQLLDSNWRVCSQNPVPETEMPIEATVLLAAVKLDEACPGEEPADTDPAEAEAEDKKEKEEPAEEEKPREEASDLSVAKQNALRSAESYLAFSAFSRSGLIDQLEYEGYATGDAKYAVDAVGANWKDQAAKSAKSYLSFTAFSHSGLIEQLEYEGFTNEQAKHGANAVNANWNEQAAKSAKSYLEFTSFSRSGLIDQLKYEGFTTEQATYAANQVGL